MRRSLILLPALLLAVTLLAAQDARPGEKTIRGKVKSIDTATGRLVVETGQGEQLKMHVGKDTTLRYAGQPADLQRFPPGTKVRLTYERRDDIHHVVEMTHGSVSAAQVKKDVNEALRSVRDYTFQQKDEYERKLQALLRNLDDQVQDLHERAAQASGPAREQLEQSARDLNTRAEVVRQRLQRVRSASADAWQDLRAGVHSALEELRDAFDRAAVHFKRDQ